VQTVSNLTIENETVCLDNKHFQNCVLLHCVLQYSGQEVLIERTAFEGCPSSSTKALAAPCNSCSAWGTWATCPATGSR